MKRELSTDVKRKLFFLVLGVVIGWVAMAATFRPTDKWSIRIGSFPYPLPDCTEVVTHDGFMSFKDSNGRKHITNEHVEAVQQVEYVPDAEQPITNVTLSPRFVRLPYSVLTNGPGL